ncbi:MAG: hypothetical protein WBX22_19560 [Silvibacterium sp.]|jgi:hypothetical protein
MNTGVAIAGEESGCPDDSGVHRTDGNQQLRRAAVLWGESGLMTFPRVLCVSGCSASGNQKNEQQ